MPLTGATPHTGATSLAGESSLTFGDVVRRCLLAGAIAGVAAASVSWLLVETSIRPAVALEQAREAADPGRVHAEMFSRSTQVVGGMVAALVVGLLLGATFAVGYAFLRHRLPGTGDFGRCVVLAGIGFGAVALLPAVKYPANPPGVGDPETVGTRTLLYLTVIATGFGIALAAGLASAVLRRRRLADAVRQTAVALLVVLLVAVVLVAWPPSPDVIPPDVPAALVWRFRLDSLTELAVLWSVIGVGSGLLLEGLAARRVGVPTPAAGAAPPAPRGPQH